MSRIAALDEITEQIGPPTHLRWVSAPFGATVAIARFRHRGAVLDLSASGVFRLIFHLSDSDVETQRDAERPSRRTPRAGSIITSPTLRRERIQVARAADTLHLFFSPEFVKAVKPDQQHHLSRAAEPSLRASAVQVLVGIARRGTEAELEHAVDSVARTLARSYASQPSARGGLSTRVGLVGA